MAMADLASHTKCPSVPGAQTTDGPAHAPAVPLSQISERQHITVAYLEQLFQHLRRAGLVDSTRGRTGGYRLARPAREISVAEIMGAVDEGTRMTRCLGHDSISCTASERCLTHNLWVALGDEIGAFLGRVSLQDVVEGLPGRKSRWPDPSAGNVSGHAGATVGGSSR